MNQPSMLNYVCRDGLWEKVISVYGQIGWLLCIVALITIMGIPLLPVMIPAWIAALIYRKRRVAAAESAARALISGAGLSVTKEISSGDAVLLVDEKTAAFAYWERGSFNFTPGIAKLSEVTGVDWNKDGDIYENIAVGINTKTKAGAVRFQIKFSRLDQPLFRFRLHNLAAAELLMQQFSILAELN